MTEEKIIKVNDRVKATWILSEGHRNERHISDTGRVAFFTKDGFLAIETDHFNPKIWFAKIENVEVIE